MMCRSTGDIKKGTLTLNSPEDSVKVDPWYCEHALLPEHKGKTC